MSDVLDKMWDTMQAQLSEVRKQIARQSSNSERAEYTDGIPAYAFANLPTEGLADGTGYITLAWVSNGRKTGEGGGAGTGVLAVYNAAGNNWLRVGDYTAVVI